MIVRNNGFILDKNDLSVEYYRGSGAGGQKRNKTSSACRITHKASGATGQAQDERSQTQNKKLALQRLVNSKQFKIWSKMQIAIQEEGYKNLETKVDKLMSPENLKVETYIPNE